MTVTLDDLFVNARRQPGISLALFNRSQHWVFQIGSDTIEYWPSTQRVVWNQHFNRARFMSPTKLWRQLRRHAERNRPAEQPTADSRPEPATDQPTDAAWVERLQHLVEF